MTATLTVSMSRSSPPRPRTIEPQSIGPDELPTVAAELMLESIDEIVQSDNVVIDWRHDRARLSGRRERA